MAQDMYASPPQILPCDDINLPDLRYLNSDYAPVKHPFKDIFNIESYNSMWLDKYTPVHKPNLLDICRDSIPSVDSNDNNLTDKTPTDASPTAIPPSPISVPRPDTIEEMDSNLKDNITEESEPTSIPIEESLTSSPDTNPAQDVNVHADLDGKLYFISYRGSGTVRPRWYLVHVHNTNAEQVNPI